MSKKISTPKITKGNGYVATWQSGALGWWMPDNIHPLSTGAPNQHAIEKNYLSGERLFLCEIIIKPLKDKKGRPITKIIK
jgi:hypothetical protein